jgi:hypothetical protein
MNPSRPCTLADGFSVWQKVYAQGTFFTFIIAGSVGIARADWPWLVPYALVCWYGVPGIVMRHLSCPRCAHLHRHGDCLQFPAKWAAWLVKEQKTTPFTRTEWWSFHFIFAFLPIYPIYWLLAQPVLLAVFGVSAAMWYLGQWLYFCKRCRVDACPYNRAPAGSS